MFINNLLLNNKQTLKLDITTKMTFLYISHTSLGAANYHHFSRTFKTLLYTNIYSSYTLVFDLQNL